jgi:hypothetical protein
VLQVGRLHPGRSTNATKGRELNTDCAAGMGLYGRGDSAKAFCGL